MRKIEQLTKNQEKFGINFKHHVQHLATPTGRLNLKVSGKRKKILDFSWTSASDTGSTTTSHLQGKIERFLCGFLKNTWIIPNQNVSPYFSNVTEEHTMLPCKQCVKINKKITNGAVLFLQKRFKNGMASTPVSNGGVLVSLK